MRPKRSPRLALGAALLLAALPPFAGCISLADPIVGREAPAFELVSTEGRPLNLSTYAGRYLIVDLMATWCGPCRLEVEHLKDVRAAYGNRIAILSVGADSTEGPAALARFKEEHDAPWEFAADPSGSVARAYGLRILPKTIVVDPGGQVVFAREGEVYPSAYARVFGDEPAQAPVAWGDVALSVGAGLLAGFAAPLSPFLAGRLAQWRTHAAKGAAIALHAAALAAISLVAYRASGFVSGRATYGGLLLGLALLIGAVYAPRWRRKGREPLWAEGRTPGRAALRSAMDFLYYGLAYFALPLVLALRATSLPAFIAPLAAFAAAAAAAQALAARSQAGLDPGLRTVGTGGAVACGLALAAASGGAFGEFF